MYLTFLGTTNSSQRILSKKFRKSSRKVTSHGAQHSSRPIFANYSKRRKVADKIFKTDQKSENYRNRQQKIQPTMGLVCYSLLRI